MEHDESLSPPTRRCVRRTDQMPSSIADTLQNCRCQFDLHPPMPTTFEPLCSHIGGPAVAQTKAKTF